MPSPASRLNSQIYHIGTSKTAALTSGKLFHTVTCLTGGVITLLGDLTEFVAGSSTDTTIRATDYVEAGDYGYTQGLLGKLIEDDAELDNSVTGTFTASQSGGTVADSTVTVTRAGVDVTASVTPPAFDGITTGSGGAITAIIPTSTVGADLKVGDVLTFNVIVSAASIGGATLTLEADDIDLAAGIYLTASGTSVAVTMLAGQTITGRFTSIVTDGTAILIGYK